jgi:uncharacterized protein YbaR (Trm112 family)
MELSENLLSILRCPESRQKLALAPAGIIAALNKRIAAGDVRTRGGAVVTDPITAGLLREDGQLLYLIDDGFPVLLIDEAIPLGPAS